MVDWNCGTRRKDKLHKPASQMLRKSQYARKGGSQELPKSIIRTDRHREKQKAIYLQLLCFIFKPSTQQSSSWVVS